MTARLRTLPLGLCALCLCMCVGTETDNPTVEFEASECKSSEGQLLSLAPPVARTDVALSLEDAAYDRLTCVAWETGADGALAIDVINYKGGCHARWELGEASVSGDQLALGIGVHQCIIAACGSCAYDFHFDVEPVDTSRPLHVALEKASCSEDEEAAVTRVTLPLHEQSEGVRCRFLGGVGFTQECGSARTPRCDAEQRPFHTPCDDVNARLCDEGLVCVDGLDQSGTGICITACETDEDCAFDLESCQDGACLLRDTF